MSSRMMMLAVCFVVLVMAAGCGDGVVFNDCPDCNCNCFDDDGNDGPLEWPNGDDDDDDDSAEAPESEDILFLLDPMGPSEGSTLTPGQFVPLARFYGVAISDDYVADVLSFRVEDDLGVLTGQVTLTYFDQTGWNQKVHYTYLTDGLVTIDDELTAEFVRGDIEYSWVSFAAEVAPDADANGWVRVTLDAQTAPTSLTGIDNAEQITEGDIDQFIEGDWLEVEYDEV